MGLLLILISIISGICIVIFSFKFMGGSLNFVKYIKIVAGLSLGGMIIAVIGIKMIKFTIDIDDIKKG